ncbi:MAG: hypothetical protein LUD74_06530 [Tannerellaceae bacterium]|nr:hypothetical protein [Tannerellaceae bacterium]
MANKRVLKKTITYLTEDLFTEALVCKLYVTGIHQEKLEQVMTRILNMQGEFIKRANRPDGKDNKTLVKEYYSKLKVDLRTEFDSIVQELEYLCKKGKNEEIAQ